MTAYNLKTVVRIVLYLKDQPFGVFWKEEKKFFGVILRKAGYHCCGPMMGECVNFTHQGSTVYYRPHVEIYFADKSYKRTWFDDIKSATDYYNDSKKRFNLSEL